MSDRYLGNKRGTIRGRGKGPRDSEELSRAMEKNSTTTSSGLSALSDEEIEALTTRIIGSQTFRRLPNYSELLASAFLKLEAELARRKGGEG